MEGSGIEPQRVLLFYTCKFFAGYTDVTARHLFLSETERLVLSAVLLVFTSDADCQKGEASRVENVFFLCDLFLVQIRWSESKSGIAF